MTFTQTNFHFDFMRRTLYASDVKRHLNSNLYRNVSVPVTIHLDCVYVVLKRNGGDLSFQLYRAHTKYGEGNVFTVSVLLSTGGILPLSFPPSSPSHHILREKIAYPPPRGHKRK